jgi:Trm5-related predicted tRNA methylase
MTQIYTPKDIEVQVMLDIADRQKRGLNKYGVSVANNPLSLREWLQHQYEELLDASIYCRRAMQEIDKQQDDLK